MYRRPVSYEWNRRRSRREMLAALGVFAGGISVAGGVGTVLTRQWYAETEARVSRQRTQDLGATVTAARGSDIAGTASGFSPQLIERVRRATGIASVVYAHEEGDTTGAATAWFAADGSLVTAGHLITADGRHRPADIETLLFWQPHGDNTIHVFERGSFDVTTAYTEGDYAHDLAVISLSKKAVVASVAGYRPGLQYDAAYAAQPGEQLMIAGFPREAVSWIDPLTATPLVIAAAPVTSVNNGYWWVNAETDHGSSGGPVVDHDGRVVGMTNVLSPLTAYGAAVTGLRDMTIMRRG